MSGKEARETRRAKLGTRAKAVVLTTAIGLTAAIVPATVAYGATASVYEGMTTPGVLYQYATTYFHTPYGTPISFNAQYWPPCGGYLRLGLRNPASGVQVSDSEEWHAYGSKYFYLTSTGLNSFPAGSYALNGRFSGACWLDPGQGYFSGILTY